MLSTEDSSITLGYFQTSVSTEDKSKNVFENGHDVTLYFVLGRNEKHLPLLVCNKIHYMIQKTKMLVCCRDGL